jgi:hypothetical protein
MAEAVYFLCAVTSAACAILAFLMSWRYRRHATGLVFWSTLSFACFAISNALVFADFVVLETVHLAVARAATGCLGGGLLLFGLIWETA